MLGISQKMMIPIIFDNTSRDLMFRILDKSTNEEGYLVEQSNPLQRVLTPDGEYIKPKEVGVVRPGSQVYIKKDIVSLIKFASDLV